MCSGQCLVLPLLCLLHSDLARRICLLLGTRTRLVIFSIHPSRCAGHPPSLTTQQPMGLSVPGLYRSIPPAVPRASYFSTVQGSTWFRSQSPNPIRASQPVGDITGPGLVATLIEASGYRSNFTGRPSPTFIYLHIIRLPLLSDCLLIFI